MVEAHTRLLLRGHLKSGPTPSSASRFAAWPLLRQGRRFTRRYRKDQGRSQAATKADKVASFASLTGVEAGQARLPGVAVAERA